MQHHVSYGLAWGKQLPNVHGRRTALRPEHFTSKQRLVSCHAQENITALQQKALEGALQSINKIIMDHEAKERKKRAGAGPSNQSKPADTAPPGKLVTFRASSALDKLIKEPTDAAPNRSLTNYLSLPLDQYTLLDPRWITRDPQQPQLFILSVPLSEIMGINLQPQITIKVDIDASNGQVRFFADKFKLGDARFDKDFQLDMHATLCKKPPPGKASRFISNLLRSNNSSSASAGGPQEAGAMPQQSTSSPSSAPHAGGELQAFTLSGASAAVSTNQQAIEPMVMGAGSHAGHAAAATISSSSSGSSSMVPTAATVADGSAAAAPSFRPPPVTVDNATAQLSCSTDVGFSIVFPHPLSVVPKPLLAFTGSLIARFAIQALLPGFLELLAVDYHRWATGSGQRGETAGSLLGMATKAAAQATKKAAAQAHAEAHADAVNAAAGRAAAATAGPHGMDMEGPVLDGTGQADMVPVPVPVTVAIPVTVGIPASTGALASRE